MSSTATVLVPDEVLNSADSLLVLISTLKPVANLDRFQPAGFPEIGHVIYRAPRDGGREENVCIVDSPASMANHLESVCMRSAHDYELVDDLQGMPYLRCVTGQPENGKLKEREVVVTSLTEGHRIASHYFLQGALLNSEESKFEDKLVEEFGIALPGSSKAHPPAEKWWNVFRTIFQYDPNSLVHGVLFPRWQIKIPRFLTAHLEAFDAGRVDRSGVKFDRLGSGQLIFAVDDATAREIRATFILDLNLVRSFGRQNGDHTLGLAEKQKEFLVALALWKIKQLLATPFRFRSGCYLQCVSLEKDGVAAEIDVDIRRAIGDAGFETDPQVTDVWWPHGELYRKGAPSETGDESEGSESEQEAEE
jgi:CRISPR-associated protein Csb1